jgi:outer membrane receptor protein involved in Fe transport
MTTIPVSPAAAAVTCILASASLLIAAPVNAQAPASAETPQLEEIVVTAQKREESLQDVPLSVNAVSGDKLAAAGIVRMDDLKSYVPNLQMTETGIANNIYIRGIGSGLNQGFEQSVSTYADGIYRGRGPQSRMPFLDLARVEVLRGPQPILFGKNAVAGAVNLVSARPGAQREGLARVSYDVENHETIGTAMISGPVTDTVGARFALHYRDADGYIENLTLQDDEPRRRELAGRATLTWALSDALDATLRIEAGSFDVVGRQIEIFGETPITTGALTGLTYSQIVGGTPPFPQGQNATARNNIIDFRRSSNGDSSNLDTFETGLTINYAFGNGNTLTSVTGFSKYELREVCDCDFVGATVFDAAVNEDYDQFSEELRLASPVNQPVSWIGGLFYQRYDLDEDDYLHVPSTSLVVPVLAQSFAGNPALGGTPQSRAALANFFSNAANPRVFTQDSKMWSAFAQATWSITDVLRLTGGGRWSKEDKDGSRVTRLTAGVGGPSLPAAVLPLFNQVLGIIPHSLAGSRSESTFSPLVNLQYDFAANSMLYLSWSRGSKAGGFDARSNKPPIAGGTPLTSGSFEFEDEQATTYELGVKSGIGGSAEINANLFFTDYKDLQTSAFDGAIGFNVGNGSAEVKGAELEGRWQATRRLRLSGSVAYLDFEWTNYFGQCYFGLTPIATGPNAGNCDYKGYTNQLAPKLTGVVSADYAWPIGDRLLLTTTADLVYSDDYLTSLTLDPATTRDSFTKINARIALGSAENHWELALVGRNLTDETTISYSGDTPLASRLFRARSYYGFVDSPRSIAIEGTVRF